MSLVFMFGRAVGEKKQGYVIFSAMLFLLMISIIGVSYLENANMNYEGKETRFGITTSSIWSVFTTSAANGSVNSTHSSYTPIAGGIQILLMGIGEVVFGGVGSGLYTMIAFIIITVFIAGLMVGRTPEYLGKKIEPFEMKMAMLVILTTPFCILITNSILCLLPDIIQNINNFGAHGFSEILYAAVSTGANNGSAFNGFNANIPIINILLGINMIIGRFLPIYGIIKISESLSNKKKIPTNPGTLQTSNLLFAILLIIIVVIIGALSYFPSLALGPIAEALSM